MSNESIHQREGVNVPFNADIEKYTIISGTLGVSFGVSFGVRSHPVTHTLILTIYGPFTGRFKSKHQREALHACTSEGVNVSN